MPSVKGPRASVRLARLDDASGVSEVHRSHVDRWFRRIGEERYDIDYGALSVDERWGFGGPWMSVETCAAHLNHLLITRCYPLVLQSGDRLAAEMELFVQREGPPYHKNCHIGLLYVHKGFTNRGFGRQMVDHALQFAREQQCNTISVSSRPEHENFYRKCGFNYSDQIVDVRVGVKGNGERAKPLPRPLNPQSFTWGMDMKIGRYQSSGYHVNGLSERLAVPSCSEIGVRTGFCSVAGHPSMFALVCHANVNAALAWTKGAGTRDLATALIGWLHDGGLQTANLLMSLKDYEEMKDGIEGQVVGTRRALIYPLRGGP